MSRSKGRRAGRPRGRREPAAAGRRRARWPWWLAGGIALAASIAAVVVGTRPPGFEPADPAAFAGASLYGANCAMCHGQDLRGTDHGPPFLDVIYAPNHHADEAFQRAVAFGVVAHHWDFGPMPPIPGLDRDEVAKIIAFVRAHQEAAGILRDPSHP